MSSVGSNDFHMQESFECVSPHQPKLPQAIYSLAHLVLFDHFQLWWIWRIAYLVLSDLQMRLFLRKHQ